MESKLVLLENNPYSPHQLSLLLKTNIKGLTFLEALKCYYRPYICPFHLLLRFIPANSNLFDIGFGSGLFLYLSSELLKLKKVAGIEINQNVIDKAEKFLNKSNNTPFDLRTFNGIDLPENIQEYDYVSMIDVYHHIPSHHQIEFIERLYQKMKPGAQLIFKDIDAGDLLYLPFNKLHDLVLTGEIGNEVSSQFALQRFKEIGFKLKESFKDRNLCYSHYFFLFEK